HFFVAAFARRQERKPDFWRRRLPLAPSTNGVFCSRLRQKVGGATVTKRLFCQEGPKGFQIAPSPNGFFGMTTRLLAKSATRDREDHPTSGEGGYPRPE